MNSPGTPPGGPDLDRLACGLLTVDASGTVVYANASLASILGRDVEEIVGRHVDGLLPAPSRILFSTHLFPLLRVQRVAEELYLPMLAADGTELPMLLNGRVRDVEAGVLFDLVAVPMRQRNAMESELIAARNAALEAASAKDRFLSIVSHELRSPLAGITGYADLLLRGRRGPLTDDQRVYVERIRDAAHYQASLIEDILDFAAIGGGRDLGPTVASLEDVLARAEGVLIVRADEEGRSLVRRPQPAPGVMRADPRAVQQILLNLGTNALKYGGAESPIQIEAEHAGERVRIRVIDEGPGIPPEQIDRIFEPFVAARAIGRSARPAGDRPRSRHQPRSGTGDGRRHHGDQHRRPGQHLHAGASRSLTAAAARLSEARG